MTAREAFVMQPDVAVFRNTQICPATYQMIEKTTRECAKLKTHFTHNPN